MISETDNGFASALAAQAPSAEMIVEKCYAAFFSLEAAVICLRCRQAAPVS